MSQDPQTGHDPVAQTLSVAVALPSSPVAICDAKFLHTLAVVELEVARLNISTPTENQGGANLIVRLTGAAGALEKAREQAKKPFLDAGRMIDAAAAAPKTRIESALRLVKTKVAAYEQAQRDEAARLERERLAEVRRLEELGRKEQADRDRKAAELARIAEENRRKLEEAAKLAPPVLVEVVEWDDEPAPQPEPVQKTETEIALERVKFAPAAVAVAPKAQGVATRVTLVIDSIDLTKLPDVFVIRTANERAIRATFCQGFRDGDAIPECAGVAFRIHREVVSTGRSAF